MLRNIASYLRPHDRLRETPSTQNLLLQNGEEQSASASSAASRTSRATERSSTVTTRVGGHQTGQIQVIHSPGSASAAPPLSSSTAGIERLSPHPAGVSPGVTPLTEGIVYLRAHDAPVLHGATSSSVFAQGVAAHVSLEPDAVAISTTSTPTAGSGEVQPGPTACETTDIKISRSGKYHKKNLRNLLEFAINTRGMVKLSDFHVTPAEMKHALGSDAPSVPQSIDQLVAVILKKDLGFYRLRTHGHVLADAHAIALHSQRNKLIDYGYVLSARLRSGEFPLNYIRMLKATGQYMTVSHVVGPGGLDADVLMRRRIQNFCGLYVDARSYISGDPGPRCKLINRFTPHYSSERLAAIAQFSVDVYLKASAAGTRDADLHRLMFGLLGLLSGQHRGDLLDGLRDTLEAHGKLQEFRTFMLRHWNEVNYLWVGTTPRGVLLVSRAMADKINALLGVSEDEWRSIDVSEARRQPTMPEHFFFARKNIEVPEHLQDATLMASPPQTH